MPIATTSPELPRLSRHENPETIIAAIEEAGAVIVEDLMTERQIASLVAEVRPHVDQADPNMRHVNQTLQTLYREVRNVTGLAGKSPTFVDAIPRVNHPRRRDQQHTP